MKIISIGKELRARRRELDITQEQLGNQLGVSKAYISKVENDKANLSWYQLHRFLYALKLSIDFKKVGKRRKDE